MALIETRDKQITEDKYLNFENAIINFFVIMDFNKLKFLLSDIQLEQRN